MNHLGKVMLILVIAVVMIAFAFSVIEYYLAIFLGIMALCWGFIGIIGAIEKLGKKK